MFVSFKNLRKYKTGHLVEVQFPYPAEMWFLPKCDSLGQELHYLSVLQLTVSFMCISSSLNSTPFSSACLTTLNASWSLKAFADLMELNSDSSVLILPFCASYEQHKEASNNTVSNISFSIFNWPTKLQNTQCCINTFQKVCTCNTVFHQNIKFL